MGILAVGSSEVIATLLQAEPFAVQVHGCKWHFSSTSCLGFCVVKNHQRWDRNRLSKHKDHSRYKCSATTRWIHEWNVVSASRAVFPRNYHLAWCAFKQLASCWSKLLCPGLLTHGTIHGLHSRVDLHNLNFSEWGWNCHLKNMRFCVRAGNDTGGEKPWCSHWIKDH